MIYADESPEIDLLLTPDKEILWAGWDSTQAVYSCRIVMLQSMGVSLEQCAVRLGPDGLFFLHDGKVLMEHQWRCLQIL